VARPLPPARAGELEQVIEMARGVLSDLAHVFALPCPCPFQTLLSLCSWCSSGKFPPPSQAHPAEETTGGNFPEAGPAAGGLRAPPHGSTIAARAQPPRKGPERARRGGRFPHAGHDEARWSEGGPSGAALSRRGGRPSGRMAYDLTAPNRVRARGYGGGTPPQPRSGGRGVAAQGPLGRLQP